MRLKTIFLALALATATMAQGGPVFDAVMAGDTAELKRLIDDGADVNEPNIIPPLQIAAFNGHTEAVELLVAQGADLEATSTMLGTALHAAAQKGYAEAIEIMIKAGADPNARNNDQFTPLMTASANGHARAARALIEADADVDAIGRARSTSKGGYGNVNALHLARANDYENVIELLEAAGAKPKPPLKVSELIAAADPELGRDLANQRCDQCHKIESEDEVVINPKQGLSLVGIFGRPIASRDDFEYSIALRQMDGVWTEELLYSFAVDAMLTVPGTLMRWHDGWTDDEVAHIVAYFKSVAE
jgi:cytochrome c2